MSSACLDPGGRVLRGDLQLGCGNPPRCAQVPFPDWLVGEKRGGWGWSGPPNWLTLGYGALKVLGTLLSTVALSEYLGSTLPCSHLCPENVRLIFLSA